MEKVSLVDAKPAEWWTLRKAGSSTLYKQSFQEPDENDIQHKSFLHHSGYKSHYGNTSDTSSTYKSAIEASINKFGKRLSDANIMKSAHNRLSTENDQCLIPKNSEDVKNLNSKYLVIN